MNQSEQIISVLCRQAIELANLESGGIVNEIKTSLLRSNLAALARVTLKRLDAGEFGAKQSTQCTETCFERGLMPPELCNGCYAVHERDKYLNEPKEP